MVRFQMVPHPRPNILELYAERESIQMLPPYQRISGVWNDRKRRLLIDSIVNGVDLPKIYFHELNPPVRDERGRTQRYAVVDGKQRLDSIFDFLCGSLALPDDFQFFEDARVDARGLHYDGLAQRHPRLRARFDGTDLPIVVVRTDDIDFIEELFSRLNEAVALTAPEYRNTLGGPLPRMFRALSTHALFVESLPFPTDRHRYLDLAAKFTHLAREDEFQSTKKLTLDGLVRTFKDAAQAGEPWADQNGVAALQDSVEEILAQMHCFFLKPDELLEGIGWVTLLFHVFRRSGHRADGFSREIIEEFRGDVTSARRKARDITRGLVGGTMTDREQLLAQFDSLRQSPNDGSALRRRYELLRRDFMERHGVELPEPD